MVSLLFIGTSWSLKKPKRSENRRKDACVRIGKRRENDNSKDTFRRRHLANHSDTRIQYQESGARRTQTQRVRHWRTEDHSAVLEVLLREHECYCVRHRQRWLEETGGERRTVVDFIGGRKTVGMSSAYFCQQAGLDLSVAGWWCKFLKI